MDFNGKIAVITGATSGIGDATAQMFAKRGATVILVGRNKIKGLKLEKEIQENGNKAEFYQCDISDRRSVEIFSKTIVEKYNHVDILFNNAGVMLPSLEIDQLSEDDWKETFEVNINGLFYITKNLINLILKCKGTIVNNASIAGMHSYITGRSYAYSASKAAVIQFTRQMAKNYAPKGVRVNCVCPGIIDTPILGDRNRNIYAERVPIGRIGQPKDVAKAVLFLASVDASYITGTSLPVDGGVMLGEI